MFSKSHPLAAAGIRRGGAGAIGERPTPVTAQTTALWLLPVLALGAVLRFYQLGDESLWSDETFSWQRAHWTLGQIWGPATRLSWIAQPSLLAAVFDAARLYGNPYLTLGTPWAQVLSPVPFLGLLAVWHWRDRWPAVAALLVFILGVPAVTWLSGFVFHPIWIDRVVLWPLGIGFVLVAGGALAIRSRAARMGVIGLVMAAHGANLAAYYRQVVKPPWQQIVAEVTAALEEHDAVLYLPRSVARLFAYYGRRSQLAPRDFVLVRERPVDESSADPEALERSITADRLYRLALRRDAPGILSLDRLPEVASNFERAWVIMWARSANDPDDVVLTRLQELGPVLQYGRYGWEVEVLLIDLERRSSLGLKLPDARASAERAGAGSQLTR